MALSHHRITTSTIAAIHTLKTRAKLDDDTYRDLLKLETGQTSAKDLNMTQAGRVIDRLRDLAGGAGPSSGAVAGLDTPLGRKLRALWIAGHDLAIVRDRTDRAMLSFVQRQTGVSHTRFLKDVHAGNSAVHALKEWLGRAGKVAWPRDRFDAIGNKRAVIDAQWLLLVELGAVKPFRADQPLGDLEAYAFKAAGKQGWCFFEPHHYDEVQKALGRKLRAFVNRRAGAAS